MESNWIELLIGSSELGICLEKDSVLIPHPCAGSYHAFYLSFWWFQQRGLLVFVFESLVMLGLTFPFLHLLSAQ